MCHIVRGDSPATKFDRLETAFILALSCGLKPLTDEGGEETGVPGKKPSHIAGLRPEWCISSMIYVTLHHKMSRNVPDGHFRVSIFSESKCYAMQNDENHFQIRGLVAELHVSEYGSMTFGTFGKTCFKRLKTSMLNQ